MSQRDIQREREDIARTVAGWTVCSMFQDQVRVRPDAPALHTRRGGAWQPVTWGQYGERVRALSLALMELGLEPGQAVAILSGPREEYHVSELAVLHAGGVPVTLYQSLAPGQVAYITDHSEAVLALAESAAQAEKFLKVRGEVPGVRRLALFEGAEEYPGEPWIQSLETLLARGRELARARAADFEARWRAVTPESLATLIYTSGTTGPPKGAMLTHGAVCWTQESGHRLMAAEPGWRVVAYLPVAHIAERNLSLYGALRSARSVYFCPALEALGQTLTEVRPHLFFAVPRIWEKMHAALLAAVQAEPDPARRAAVEQALAAALRAVDLEQAGQPVAAELQAARRRADEAIFARFRERLGLDQARLMASGAAPIAPEILRFFHAIGLPVVEVYGQTEDCGPTSIVRPDRVRIGTVGPSYPGVEVRLAEDGEILVRGGNVFSGYFKDPDLTRQTLEPDGWLHSGDIGTLDRDGFLAVVDRKKDVIITAGGKNITPSNLENALKREPLVSQAMVVGDRRPYLAALITLDEAAVRQWARGRGLPAEDWEALLGHPDLRAEVQGYVDRVNAEVSRVEQIKRFALLPADWSPATEELTPTMKVRRRVVLEKYADLIASLYP